MALSLDDHRRRERLEIDEAIAKRENGEHQIWRALFFAAVEELLAAARANDPERIEVASARLTVLVES